MDLVGPPRVDVLLDDVTLGDVHVTAASPSVGLELGHPRPDVLVLHGPDLVLGVTRLPYVSAAYSLLQHLTGVFLQKKRGEDNNGVITSKYKC